MELAGLACLCVAASLFGLFPGLVVTGVGLIGLAVLIDIGHK